MSNYVKATNFRIKDSLTTGDPNKRIKGQEIDDEFVALATAVSSKADSASPAFTGTPTAPTASAGNNSTQIATTAFVFQNGVPIGSIFMWGGLVSAIPSGYALCDGTSGTPDLRNRMVIGAADIYSVGATGGNKNSIVVSHTHTEVAAGSHVHTVDINSTGVNGTTSAVCTSTSVTVADASPDFMTSSGEHSHTINTTGESGTDKNLPPYYALAFIQRVS